MDLALEPPGTHNVVSATVESIIDYGSRQTVVARVIGLDSGPTEHLLEAEITAAQFKALGVHVGFNVGIRLWRGSIHIIRE